MTEDITSYAGVKKSPNVNWKGGFYVASVPTGSTDPVYTKFHGHTNISHENEDVMVEDTFYNTGGTPTRNKVGTRVQFTVSGKRDKNDEGQNLVFTAGSEIATGEECYMYCKFVGEDLTYEGLALVFGTYARWGDAADTSNFELSVEFDGVPEITTTAGF